MKRPVTMRSRALLAAAVTGLICALGGCGASGARPPAAAARAQATVPPTVATVPSTTTTTTTAPRTPEPASTAVAVPTGNVAGSARPGGPPVTTVPATWYGYQSALPVTATAPGWLEVRLAQRPNGSTAWIPASDATLSTTPYYLVLNLTTEHLEVFREGRPILSFPAGIGTTTDPTVTGDFFIAMKAPAPDPGYGPFMLVTSAHSDAIADWEGLGDAIIAIHGPIDAYDDQLIGTTGARISHGCIRLHDSDLAQLAEIPAGTPLRIVS